MRSQKARTWCPSHRSSSQPAMNAIAIAIIAPWVCRAMNDHSKAGAFGRSGSAGRRPVPYAHVSRLVATAKSNTVSASRLDVSAGTLERGHAVADGRDLHDVAAAGRCERVDADARHVRPEHHPLADAVAREGGADDRVPRLRAQQQVPAVQREARSAGRRRSPRTGGRGRSRPRRRNCGSTPSAGPALEDVAEAREVGGHECEGGDHLDEGRGAGAARRRDDVTGR